MLPEQRDEVEMLALMLLIRRFEERASQQYQAQKIGGFCHLYIGQEAVVCGAVAATRHDDYIITAYRDHAHALARGTSPEACMAELFGKETGCSRGLGGSMHFFDRQNHMYGGHAIVGAQFACGRSADIVFRTRSLQIMAVVMVLCPLDTHGFNDGVLFDATDTPASSESGVDHADR